MDNWALSQESEDVTIDALLEEFKADIRAFRSDLLAYGEKVRKALIESP